MSDDDVRRAERVIARHGIACNCVSLRMRVEQDGAVVEREASVPREYSRTAEEQLAALVRTLEETVGTTPRVWPYCAPGAEGPPTEAHIPAPDQPLVLDP